ncbi:MAG TPA: aldehyde dehydrogenase family protein, partial [Solirubrobacteraceae bacterium]|nr:aldehyde dehydrogenase family protein [Solirubrobacteraceae bacterium]
MAMAPTPGAEPASGTRLEALSPVTGEAIGSVAAADGAAISAAVDEAALVQRLWARLRLRDRARYMELAAQAVIAELDELADLICAEQGRPRTEAMAMELLPAVETLRWLADEGPRVLAGERAHVAQAVHPGKRARWSYEPLGVVAVLGPAAEPFATPLGDVAVALMAGNGVVLKPSPHACLAGERIGRLFARAGIPEGLLQVVQGHADAGRALVADPVVAQVRFTGSLGAGREVGQACARLLRRAVLETGGKDAMLVLADAPLERAIAGAVWGAFANAGQSGASVERAIVVAEVAEPFVEGVVRATRALRVGDPREHDTDVGPLVAHDRLERVDAALQQAVADGAVVRCGGVRRGGRGAYVEPVVVTGVHPAMRIMRDEVPGPVLAIAVVDDEADAIALANDAEAALSASVWTADRHKALRIARELRTGMVWCNDHLTQRGAPQVPWGGAGGSGIGRARGAIALRTCAEPKAVTWD